MILTAFAILSLMKRKPLPPLIAAGAGRFDAAGGGDDTGGRFALSIAAAGGETLGGQVALSFATGRLDGRAISFEYCYWKVWRAGD